MLIMESLMTLDDKNWDGDILLDLLTVRNRETVLRVAIAKGQHCDKIIWAANESEDYTIKSCYRRLIGGLYSIDDFSWTRMLKFGMPLKIKTFFWQTNETSAHLFAQCIMDRSCWDMFAENFGRHATKRCGTTRLWAMLRLLMKRDIFLMTGEKQIVGSILQVPSHLLDKKS
nr:uncharacterized protein LOC109167502 [Ipomoea batatas]